MEALLLILKNNKLSTALGALLLIATVTIGIQHLTAMYYRAEIKTQRVTIAWITEANGQLKASIEQQNAAILQLQTDAAARIAASERAVSEATAAAASSNARAAALLALKTTGNDCGQTKQVLDFYYGGLRP